VNVTPDHCIADFDIRLPPGADHLKIVEQVESITPEGVSIGLLDFKPAVESRPDDPFVQLCGAVCERHLGRRPAVKGVSYYSDGAVLLAGLSVPFAIVGPGNLGLSSQPNEWVSIDNVRRAVGIYAEIAATWLA
jgi:succinyl-diaminopimelate desuccinylase